MKSLLLAALLTAPANAGVWQDTLAAHAQRADCREGVCRVELGPGSVAETNPAGVVLTAESPEKETLRFELDLSGRLLKAVSDKGELPSAEAQARLAALMNMWRGKLSKMPSKQKTVRVSSELWDPAFPFSKERMVDLGGKVFFKSASKFSCEFTAGAAAARCDFAYDVWPEMCWYGYDHVVAEVSLKDGLAKVVKKEWRAD